MVMIVAKFFMKFADTNPESSEACLTTLGKNMAAQFKIMGILCRNEVLKIC